MKPPQKASTQRAVPPSGHKPTRAQSNRSKGFLFTIALLCVFGVAVWGAFAGVGWTEAKQAISRLSVTQIFYILGLASLHYVLRALRWQVLARTVGLPTAILLNALHFFGGFAMTATPGRLGELVRLRWMAAESCWPMERLAPIAVADRATELAGMLVVIVSCVAFRNTDVAGVYWLVAVSVLLVWFSLNPRLLTWFVERTWRIIGRAPRVFVRLRRLTLGLIPFTGAGVLVLTIVISTLGWMLEGFAFYCLLNWLGVEIDVATASAIFLVAILSGALLGLPGGLGGTEAVIIILLSLQEVPVELSVIATVIIRLATLWYVVAIGAIFFSIAETRLRKHRRQAARDSS